MTERVKLTKAQRDLADTQHMYDTLKMIARGYQTPDQIRRNAEREYGIDASEALEYAYENIQAAAARAIKGKRRPAGRAALNPESKP